MARLIWRVSLWQVFPLRPSSKNPKYAIKNRPIVLPRSSFTVFAHFLLWKKWLDKGPLLILEVHAFILSKLSEKDNILCELRHTIYDIASS
jgi:hypothetical protein